MTQILASIIMSLSSFATDLPNCQCLQNLKDCELATLECAFEYKNGNDSFKRQSLIKFTADDDFMPHAVIRFREPLGNKTFVDFGAYANTCDGQTGKMGSRSILWRFNDVGTVTIDDEATNPATEIADKKNYYINHKVQNIEIKGTCLMKKL